MIRTRSIACGRKFCSNCRRWRHVCDFNGQRWVGEQPTRLSAWCKVCNRIDMRARRGHKARDFNACFRGHPWTPETTGFHNDGKRYCRVCRRIRAAELRKDPEWLERHREYTRIYSEARRRRLGMPVRKFRNRQPRAVDLEQVTRLPAAPFGVWLREREGEYESRLAMARALGLDDSLLGKLLAGKKSGVSIDAVERALVREGSTFLWQLYPSLYDGVPPAEREEVADAA